MLSICDTGQSSKKLDQESTGEKGIGFKSVFGIADRVHIQSGLWCFRFEHQQHEGGLGMISPIVETSQQLDPGVRTRFRLQYAFPEVDGLSILCARLRDQHPSVLFALRKLKKITIDFQNDESTDSEISFEKSVDEDRNLVSILSKTADSSTTHIYRTFTKAANDPRDVASRSQPGSPVTLGFPLTAAEEGLPALGNKGQNVFAVLPVMHIPQMPFLIQADFILPGSRQTVTDHAWNRTLRDEIACLFTEAISEMASEDSRMSYAWLSYIPGEPMTDFWQPFPRLVKERLEKEPVYYSLSNTRSKPKMLRLLSSEFTHDHKPLLPDSKRSWQFLSPKYHKSHAKALLELGVLVLSYDEGLDLVEDDISSKDSVLRTTPFSNSWHDSLLTYISGSLASSCGSAYKTTIYAQKIVPVRKNKSLEWHCPNTYTYFPVLVDEGTGADHIRILMPTNVDLVVLHPDAATSSFRREVYQSLGVSICSPVNICNAIERAQLQPGTKLRSDLVSSLELLFWFSHPLSFGVGDKLIAATSGEQYSKAQGLFMLSDQPYHAESLLRLHENPQYKKYFLNPMYQASSVTTRSRGDLTWERWLCEVAGARWYPPLQDSDNRSKLHWAIESICGTDSSIFLALIQKYWSQEYLATCQCNDTIKKTLSKCKVSCQCGRQEELQRTWFPSRHVIDEAEKYGLEKKLPILALPESADENAVLEWPSLSYLGVRSTLDLSFYRESLTLLSAHQEVPKISTTEMGWLYKNMADRATLDDRAVLRVLLHPVLGSVTDLQPDRIR